jgi:NADPH:quinone reductase-like Zn-dependent oxidoreductase
MGAIPATMRAWRAHAYGGPDVLRFDEMPLRQPGPGEVLVRVRAASANPIDWKQREGHVRGIFEIELPLVLGRDCAGEVAALGAGVTDVHVGEPVVALGTPGRDGTHAEYVVARATSLARKPSAISDAAAAATGVAALSALIPLDELAGVTHGHRVLIHGGAGGVGHLAIQIAKLLGAEVLATCSTANVEFCEALGARQVIDYTHQRFEDHARDCDVIFDTVGGDVHARSAGILKPGGRLVYINAAPIETVHRPDILVLGAQIAPTRERLARILRWVEQGLLKPQTAKTFAFAQAREMYAASQAGHARGKLLLCVAPYA